MNRWSLQYWSVYVLPALLLLHVALGGIWALAVVSIVVWVTPLLDAVLPVRSAEADVSADHREAAGRGHWLRLLPLRLWPLVHVSVAAVVLEALFAGQRMEFWWCASLCLALGTMAGVGGINIAHELLHRKHVGDRALAELLMSLVTYPYFCVEHVHGHHRHVATRLDPATARRGESVYRFVLRSVFGSLKQFWAREGRRCHETGTAGLSPKNRRLRYLLNVGAVYGLIGALWGPWALLFWLGQSAVAVFMLEIINYVEHYGLEREIGPNGTPVRVQPAHSWNSRARFSNWILFNLPLHADHHHTASKPYWELEAREGAPVFPAGYGSMLLLALVPPLWRRTIASVAG